MAQKTQDHAEGKTKGQSNGWKTKQKATGVRRDAQLSALTQMVRVLAGDCLRLSAKCKVLEDVLAKRCWITREGFDASTAAVLAGMKPADQTEAPMDQAPAPPAPVGEAASAQASGVMDAPVATGDALAAA